MERAAQRPDLRPADPIGRRRSPDRGTHDCDDQTEASAACLDADRVSGRIDRRSPGQSDDRRRYALGSVADVQHHRTGRTNLPAAVVHAGAAVAVFGARSRRGRDGRPEDPGPGRHQESVIHRLHFGCRRHYRPGHGQRLSPRRWCGPPLSAARRIRCGRAISSWIWCRPTSSRRRRRTRSCR